MVLHLGEQDAVALADVGVAPGAGDEVDRLGRVADEDHLAPVAGADVVGDGRPRPLVGGGRLGRERVGAAVDVGVVGALVAVDRLDRGQHPLGAGAAVEVGDRLAVDLALERREGGADLLDRERRRGGLGGRRAHRREARPKPRLDLLADPAVALLLEHADQLRAAFLDDPALEHDVDEVGLDHVQDALVVGDDQDAHVGPGELVDALGDGAQRVDVEARVGLVEDRDLGLQQRQLQQLHPLLLAAGEAVVEVAAGEVFGDVRQLHRLLGDAWRSL